MQFSGQDGVLGAGVLEMGAGGIPQSAVLMKIHVIQTGPSVHLGWLHPALVWHLAQVKKEKPKARTCAGPHAAALMKSTLWSIDPACALIDVVFKNSLVGGVGELRGSGPSCRAHLSMFTQAQAFIQQHGERPDGPRWRSAGSSAHVWLLFLSVFLFLSTSCRFSLQELMMDVTSSTAAVI